MMTLRLEAVYSAKTKKTKVTCITTLPNKLNGELNLAQREKRKPKKNLVKSSKLDVPFCQKFYHPFDKKKNNLISLKVHLSPPEIDFI
jgi:hypothetical protein